MTFLASVAILAAIAVMVVGMHNALVRLRVQAENGWVDVDVQLKRRHDLIPSLVETVKGYAGHEKDTLEGVINARNRAVRAQGPAEKSQAEGVLGQALKSLFALSEAYPQLHAVESFNQLTVLVPRDRGRDPERAALLQRRRPRPQHQDRHLPIEPGRNDLRHHGTRLLRTRIPREAFGHRSQLSALI